MRYIYETQWGHRIEYECDLCRRRFDGEILTVRMGDKQVGDVCSECWQRLGAEEERTREQRQKDYLEHYCCAICGKRIEGNHIKGYEFSGPTRPGNSKENVINDNGYGGYNICMDCINTAVETQRIRKPIMHGAPDDRMTEDGPVPYDDRQWSDRPPDTPDTPSETERDDDES